MPSAIGTLSKEDSKKAIGQHKQHNNSACGNPFFGHFFTVTVLLRHENVLFHVVMEDAMKRPTNFTLSLSLNMVLRNSIQGDFAYI